MQYTAAASALRQAAQRLQNLRVFREAARTVLRVDERAICADVENAAAALNELGLDAELFRYFGRQTGGPRQITSTHAVLNRHSHDQAPQKYPS